MVRMKRVFAMTGLLAAVTPGMGCNLFEVFNSTRIAFENKGQHTVSLLVAYSADGAVADSEIASKGTQANFTVEAGKTLDTALPCATMRAIKIVSAKLQSSDNGPTTSSRTYRAGTDFNCGNKIIFTFTHSGLLIDFAVTQKTEP